MELRRRRKVLRFCSATQRKSFMLTTAVPNWTFFKVSLVGSRLGRREIQLGRRDIQSPHEQALMEAARQHLSGTEGVRQLQAAESLSAPVRDRETRRLHAEME